MNTCLLFMGDIGGGELMIILAAFIAFPILLVIHFIPSIIARKRPDFMVVFLVNLLAGWSIIGWVIALYLALRDIPVGKSVPPSQSGKLPVASTADELVKLRNLRDEGIITGEQFERLKGKLISHN